MRFSTYAEVLTPDHPLSKAHADGFKRTPGHLLGDVLRETGGRYEVETDIPLRAREEFRRLASQTGDSQLAALAGAKSIRISLEHLRGCDPDSTRIVYGYQLHRESGDGHLPGLDP
jgi:hypothetical protein